MNNNNYNMDTNQYYNNMNGNMDNKNIGNANAKKAGKKILALLTIGASLLVIVILFFIWMVLFTEGVKSEEYVENIKKIMEKSKDFVQLEDNDFKDENVTYYVNTNCITGKDVITSPHGEFDPAYVVITYEEEKYMYYFIGRDVKGYGYNVMTPIEKINEDNLRANIEKEDIKTNVGVGARTKVIIMDSSCKKTETNSYKVEINKIEKNDFDGKKAIKLYAYRDIETNYTVTKVGIFYASNSGLGFYTNDNADLTKDKSYNIEEIMKTNKTGNVSEIIAQNPTNKGDYALIYTVVKENDMVYALPYVEAKDENGKEYKFYGPVVASSYEQAK